MSNTFHLEILTPEYRFFEGEVEAVTVLAYDGELTVLASHTPLVAPIAVGNIRIKKDGAWQTAFNSEGFMEVRPEGPVVFVQACERPEEIDRNRAAEALRRAEERLRQKQSTAEYKQSKIALARAMARLRITKNGR